VNNLPKVVTQLCPSGGCAEATSACTTVAFLISNILIKKANRIKKLTKNTSYVFSIIFTLFYWLPCVFSSGTFRVLNLKLD